MRSLAKLVTGTQKRVLNNRKPVRTGREIEVEVEEERKKQYMS